METLKQLKDRLFMLKMQDHWDFEDYRYEDELLEKIRKLEEKDNGER